MEKRELRGLAAVPRDPGAQIFAGPKNQGFLRESGMALFLSITRGQSRLLIYYPRVSRATRDARHEERGGAADHLRNRAIGRAQLATIEKGDYVLEFKVVRHWRVCAV